MRILILVFLLFFSFLNITNAIPLPALIIGYEFILFLIPIVLGFFSIILFYFRRYIFWINSFLLIFIIILYSIHFFVTKELFFVNYEYIFFLVLSVLLFFSYKIKYIGYIIVLIMIYFGFFLIKIDYNLYEFRQIYNKFEKVINSNIKIIDVLYKDNFMVIYGYDNESKFSAYTVIENGLFDDKIYLKKGMYYIVFGGDEPLGKKLADLVYSVIN